MILIVFAAVALLGFVQLVRWERRRFLARGLADSWLKVRLSSIPAAVFVAILVVVPARSTSGMEGLAVFYVLLLVAAPLLWFGMHWAAGRLVTPALSFADSARIAVSPLAYALVVAGIAPILQSIAWSLARS
ncbi:hypothetical protein [Lysobacter brunescens]|uniref:Uncharacterized protein n=1 Tax=Lysobacter brunescens TaxID=262323 RepID=A0ABW2YAG8_9GAMM